MDYAKIIREVPDFPKQGILFKDLTTLWKDPDALKASTDEIVAEYKNKGIQKVVGAESRGFIVGAPVAYLLDAGFVPIRKKGKLPAETIEKSYALEYGEATVEVHKDAIQPGDKVLVVDDLLATGGTVKAIIELLEEMQAEIIGVVFVMELDFLKGREGIKYPIKTLTRV